MFVVSLFAGLAAVAGMLFLEKKTDRAVLAINCTLISAAIAMSFVVSRPLWLLFDPLLPFQSIFGQLTNWLQGLIARG